ncbi:23419_t:CDS:2, partial [Gigaspora rosea]
RMFSTSSSLSRTSSQNSEDEAFKECIEAIESNLDSNIINKANDKEKKWWIDGNYKAIDEKRLPLRLVKNVTYREYEKKSEIANAARCWEFDDGVVIIYELPNYRVLGTGAATCQDSGRRSAKQPDTSFVPRLPKPSPHPSDAQGNPWPTVVCEVARSQSLPHILQKVNSFWLAPNRSEDVIVLKLWPWNHTRDANQRPLRRLTCYKFCRQASLRAGQTQGNFRPVQTLEFGTINKHSAPYNGCSAPGMRTVTITPACVYKGCTPPHPLSVNAVIDLFNIQQAIFVLQ